MLLEGFWALAALLDPTPSGAPAQLVLGLALVAVVVIIAATALPAVPPAMPLATFALSRRARATERPRLADPDAPGRPRSRAPSPAPAAA
jgi:uncharacterized protein DUF6412